MHQLSEEWFSGNRRTGYYGSLTYATAMSHVLKSAPYATLATHDVVEMIREEQLLLKRVALSIALIALIAPIRMVFEVGMALIHVAAIIEALVSDVLGFILTIATLGLTMAYEQRWCFEAFMLGLEKLTGKLWQRSTVKILDRRKPCECTSPSGCQSGRCFEFERTLFLTRILIKCDCYRRHIDEILLLKRGYPIGTNYYYTGETYIERAYPGQDRLIPPEEAENCWKCDVDLHRPYYDVKRLMWIQSTYSTILSDVAQDTVIVDRKRLGLDETITVETSFTEEERNELTDWPARIFSRQYAAGEGTQLSYESIKFSKGLLTALTVGLAAVGISKEKVAGRIAAAVLLLVFISQVIRGLEVERRTSQVFRNPKKAERVLDIDMVSSGRYLTKHRGENMSWTRHRLIGTKDLGDLSWIENLVGNRSVLYDHNAVCYSRHGIPVWKSSYSSDGVARCVNWRLKGEDAEKSNVRQKFSDLCKLRVC